MALLNSGRLLGCARASGWLFPTTCGAPHSSQKYTIGVWEWVFARNCFLNLRDPIPNKRIGAPHSPQKYTIGVWEWVFARNCFQNLHDPFPNKRIGAPHSSQKYTIGVALPLSFFPSRIPPSFLASLLPFWHSAGTIRRSPGTFLHLPGMAPACPSSCLGVGGTGRDLL